MDDAELDRLRQAYNEAVDGVDQGHSSRRGARHVRSLRACLGSLGRFCGRGVQGSSPNRQGKESHGSYRIRKRCLEAEMRIWTAPPKLEVPPHCSDSLKGLPGLP